MIASPQAHWNVKEMAARVNASPSWLFAAYRAAFGVSPGRDCILARVERAKILLAQGLSVAETAERVGYSNVYHFIRQFRQATGETPGQVRPAAWRYAVVYKSAIAPCAIRSTLTRQMTAGTI